MIEPVTQKTQNFGPELEILGIGRGTRTDDCPWICVLLKAPHKFTQADQIPLVIQKVDDKRCPMHTCEKQDI